MTQKSMDPKYWARQSRLKRNCSECGWRFMVSDPNLRANCSWCGAISHPPGGTIYDEDEEKRYSS